jgi:four helix bundle protein
MPTIVRFEDIEVWQTARELTNIIEVTCRGEFARDLGLCDQIRHASVSIVSNMAEGFESRTNLLFNDYLGGEKGSAGELRGQVHVANDIGYLDEGDFSGLIAMCEKCSRQIRRFTQYLENQPNAIREEGISYNV